MSEKNTKKPQFINPEDSKLPETFSQNHWKVLGAIALLFVVAIGYKFFSQPSVKLISPTNYQTVEAKELEFRWQCNKSGVSYVIEVYDEGELVMRQITDQQNYKPDEYQLSFLKKDRKYYWVLISNPDIEQAYNFKTEIRYFQITNPIENPNLITDPPQQEPQQNPQQSLPQQTQPDLD